MNNVFLIGRLTKDVELRYTESNIPVATFTIAVNRIGTDKSDFFNIVVWRNQAENCNKYLTKGSQVAIDGKLQTRSYEKDGQRRYITEIVANLVQYLDTKKNVNETQKEEKQTQNESVVDPYAEMGEFVEVDLPF